MISKRVSYSLLIVAVIAVAWSAIFIRMADVRGVTPLAISFWRMVVATAIWLPVFYWKPGGKTAPALTKRQWMYVVFAGLALCLHFTTWITAVTKTTVASAVFVILLQPVLTASAAHIFLHEKLRRVHYVSFVLTIVGAAAITWGDIQIKPEYWFGDLLAILGVGFAALYMFIARIARPERGGVEGIPMHRYMPMVYLFATIGLGVICVLTDQPLGPYDREVWWILLATGIVPTVIGHSLFNWAAGHLPILSVNIALVGEPIGATLLAWWLFHELPSTGIWVGGPMMILAFVLVILFPPTVLRVEKDAQST